MGIKTKIEWTDHTFNPWIGCQKVSPGCDNCYAEAMSNFRGWTEWGPHGRRVLTSPKNWENPIRWNLKAAKRGIIARVFCASLCDIFDDKAPEGARERLYELIKKTPYLHWQLLTKRPENYKRFGLAEWPDNVWLGITAENQNTYDRRWPILSAQKARIKFISYEPALSDISILGFDEVPDWIIFGGESGKGARVMNPQWARKIRDECVSMGVSFFIKQYGTWRSNPVVCEQGKGKNDIDPHGKGGALLDGVLWREFPSTEKTGLFQI